MVNWISWKRIFSVTSTFPLLNFVLLNSVSQLVIYIFATKKLTRKGRDFLSTWRYKKSHAGTTEHYGRARTVGSHHPRNPLLLGSFPTFAVAVHGISGHGRPAEPAPRRRPGGLNGRELSAAPHPPPVRRAGHRRGAARPGRRPAAAPEPRRRARSEGVRRSREPARGGVRRRRGGGGRRAVLGGGRRGAARGRARRGRGRGGGAVPGRGAPDVERPRRRRVRRGAGRGLRRRRRLRRPRDRAGRGHADHVRRRPDDQVQGRAGHGRPRGARRPARRVVALRPSAVEVPLRAGDQPRARRLHCRLLRRQRAQGRGGRRARRPRPARRVRAGRAAPARRRALPQPGAGRRAGGRGGGGGVRVLRRRRRGEARGGREAGRGHRDGGGPEGVQGGGEQGHASRRHGVHLPRHAAAVQRHRRHCAGAERLGWVHVDRVLEGVFGLAPADRGSEAHARRPDGPRRPRLRQRRRQRLRDDVAGVRRQDPAEDRRQHHLPSRLLPRKVEPAARQWHEPPVRGGRQPERGGDDDDGELLLRRARAVAVHGHRAQQRDGRLLGAVVQPDPGPPPAGAGQLHRAGEAAPLLHDADDHPQGRAAGRRGGRQRRHQHHRGGDAGVPEPLRPGDEPPRRRAEPQGIPQAGAQRGAVRGRDGGRRRGHRVQHRGHGVSAAERPRAAEHVARGRVPADRAGLAGAGHLWRRRQRRRQERVPRDADGGERPEERWQPRRSMILV